MLAKDAFAAVGLIAWDDMVPCGMVGDNQAVVQPRTWLDAGDALAHALHHTGCFVAQDAWEEALRVFSPEGVGVGVAEGSGDDLDADLLRSFVSSAAMILYCMHTSPGPGGLTMTLVTSRGFLASHAIAALHSIGLPTVSCDVMCSVIGVKGPVDASD